MADVTATIREISELTPLAQQACTLFMAACANVGYNVFITETYRSQERQDYLYNQGRTRPGNKVTWTRTSRHTSRRAWDIATRGGDLYNTAVLRGCGSVAAKLGITWGGTWSTPDTPHFEIPTDWKPPEGEEIDMEELNALQEKVEYIDDTVSRLHAKVSDIDASLANLYDSVNRLIDQLTITYNTIDDVPVWGTEAVRAATEKGVLQGDGNSLAITYSDLRTIVREYRAGLYDIK